MGQPDFAGYVSNSPYVAGQANWLSNLSGIAVDQRTGRVFVADSDNNRVLSWPSAAARANGQAADLVIGAPNFAANLYNAEVGPAVVNSPHGLALDDQGDLYVVDYFDERVLEFSAPLSTGMSAHLVFGQGNVFTTTDENKGGLSRDSLV